MSLSTRKPHIAHKQGQAGNAMINDINLIGGKKMSGTCLQQMLAAVFFVLGGWALFTPELVETLAIRPEHQLNNALSKVLIVCFGAQSMLVGLILNFSRLNAMGLRLFGLFASVPALGLCFYYFSVIEIFTSWIAVQALGSLAILILSFVGARARRRELTGQCLTCDA